MLCCHGAYFKKMHLRRFQFTFIAFSLFLASHCSDLEVVDDNEFITLCQSEKYVVALFSKDNCKECDIIENEVLNIREELVDDINAWVVKIQNSNLVQIYSPNREPALVFVRHGVPLLYHGEINDELILHTFRENKVPGVKELDDSNFEHLTQSATGATTGDWFVLFYGKTCVVSSRMTARWEAVAAALKVRMNVARVNREEGGSATARRFRVYDTPTFILFRQGKLHRYDLQSLEIPDLINFATEGFKNVARAEPVPAPKGLLDDISLRLWDYISDNPWLLGIAGLSIMIGSWLGMRSRLIKPKKKDKKESGKNKKDGNKDKKEGSKDKKEIEKSKSSKKTK